MLQYYETEIFPYVTFILVFFYTKQKIIAIYWWLSLIFSSNLYNNREMFLYRKIYIPSEYIFHLSFLLFYRISAFYHLDYLFFLSTQNNLNPLSRFVSKLLFIGNLISFQHDNDHRDVFSIEKYRFSKKYRKDRRLITSCS